MKAYEKFAGGLIFGTSLVAQVLAGLTLAVATAGPAAASFTVTDLGTLSDPRGINDAGQVVGRSFTSTGPSAPSSGRTAR